MSPVNAALTVYLHGRGLVIVTPLRVGGRDPLTAGLLIGHRYGRAGLVSFQ